MKILYTKNSAKFLEHFWCSSPQPTNVLFQNQVTSRQLHKPPSPRRESWLVGDGWCSANKHSCFKQNTRNLLENNRSKPKFQTRILKQQIYHSKGSLLLWKNPTDHFQKRIEFYNSQYNPCHTDIWITNMCFIISFSYNSFIQTSNKNKKCNSQEEATKKTTSCHKEKQSDQISCFCWSQSPCLHFALQQIKACGTLLSTVACIVKTMEMKMLNVWRYVIWYSSVCKMYGMIGSIVSIV